MDYKENELSIWEQQQRIKTLRELLPEHTHLYFVIRGYVTGKKITHWLLDVFILESSGRPMMITMMVAHLLNLPFQDEWILYQETRRDMALDLTEQLTQKLWNRNHIMYIHHWV